MNKIILMAVLIIVFLLIFQRKKEKFTVVEEEIEAEENLKFSKISDKILILKNKLNNLPIINIDGRDNELKKIVHEEFKRIYKFDIESLRNLALITNVLQKDGISIPGDVRVDGSLSIGIRSILVKNLIELRAINARYLKQIEVNNKMNHYNISADNYYFFKKFPQQLNNQDNISISKRGPLVNFTFLVDEGLKGSTLRVIKKEKTINNRYFTADFLIDSKEIYFNKSIELSNKKYYQINSKLQSENLKNYQMYLINKETFYGPFDINDVLEYPGFTRIQRWINNKRELFTSIDSSNHNKISRTEVNQELYKLESKLKELNVLKINNSKISIKKMTSDEMYKIYSIDLEPMRSLSFVTEALLKNGLIIPGDVNIGGNLIVNKSQINDEIKKLTKENQIEKKRLEESNKKSHNLLQQNINAYYFFKRFPSQLKNGAFVNITREQRDSSSFWFGMEKKFGGANFNYIENYEEMNYPNNRIYPNKPGLRLYGMDIHGYRTEGNCSNSSTPRNNLNWTNAIDNNWSRWFLSYKGTIYGPFQPSDIKFCPGQSPIYKFLDFNRKNWN